jgi:hypothetical protein
MLKRSLAGPLILLAIVIGFFWKIVLTDQYSWLETPDLAYQVVPWLQYQAQQFHMHRFPIWDPFMFGGQSLIGQAQPGLAYPLNWILFSLPLDDGHISFTALNWYYTLIHYLAALFCYMLCRDLGRSTLASILGGAAFGPGGYIGNTDWPQMINGAIWGPLVFLFLFRAARGLRPVANGAFSGLFLGMSWLSGHHQVPIFLTLAAGAVWLWILLEHGRIEKHLAMPFVMFMVFFAGAGALQTLPAFDYGRIAVRWVGVDSPVGWDQVVPYLVHQRYSLSPIHLLGIVVPGVADSAMPFAGVVALALAALALATCWNVREIRILAAVGIAGLLLALARNNVFHGILYSIVPMFEKARSPGAAIYLFHFAIAVLLAFGLDALMLPAAKPWLRRLAFVLLSLGAVVFLIIFVVDLAKALHWTVDDRVMMTALVAFAASGLLYRASRAVVIRWGVPALLIGLYLVELGNVSLYALPNKEEKNRSIYLKGFSETKSVAEFLRRQPAPLRVEVNGDDVSINFGDWYGIDTSNGYAASLPATFQDLEIFTPRTKSLYGVNYTLSRKPTMDGQQEVFRDDNGLIVYKNPNALPRIWTVHQAIRVRDPQDVRAHLQDPAFDLAKKTFGYAAPPSLEWCDGDSVKSYSRGINSTTARVEMKCRGMVVQSENMAPGWVAFVDGKKTPIYEAYGALRGVVVDAGSHKLELRYRPLSVTIGALATLLTFAAALFWASGTDHRFLWSVLPSKTDGAPGTSGRRTDHKKRWSVPLRLVTKRTDRNPRRARGFGENLYMLVARRARRQLPTQRLWIGPR